MSRRNRNRQNSETKRQEFETKKYREYISEHAKEIGEKVNHQMCKSIDTIRNDFLEAIKEYLDPLPVHYEWQDDGCPYDFSGEMVKNGIVDLNQTVKEFLRHEYTGNKTATFVSGCGFSYDTYGDSLSYYTLERAEDVLHEVTRRELDLAFPNEITDVLYDQIMSFSHDDVYDNCLAYEFFLWEPAIDFVGIGDIKLSELMANTND